MGLLETLELGGMVDVMKNQITRGLTVALLGCSLCACNDAKSPDAVSAASPAASPASNPPTTAQSHPQKEEGFVASGPIVVEHQIDVSAQRDGVLSQIHADVGTLVREGQVLAQLDDLQITADLEAARAKTRSTEADLHNWESEAKVLQSDYDRAQKMWDAQLITQEQLDHARFKAESDVWDVKRVQEMLVNAQRTERSLELEMGKTRIRAPFAGIVARRYVRSGQQITKGDRMFWVTATAPLRVKFTLPERLLGKVKRGQSIEVTAADDASHPCRARVIEISPVVDPSSGTIEVLAELVAPTGDLRPGMTTNIRLPSTP
jgi:membrane fusion protein, multidrug efflux system